MPEPAEHAIKRYAGIDVRLLVISVRQRLQRRSDHGIAALLCTCQHPRQPPQLGCRSGQLISVDHVRPPIAYLVCVGPVGRMSRPISELAISRCDPFSTGAALARRQSPAAASGLLDAAHHIEGSKLPQLATANLPRCFAVSPRAAAKVHRMVPARATPALALRDPGHHWNDWTSEEP
jgi:hypothetical protein